MRIDKRRYCPRCGHSLAFCTISPLVVSQALGSGRGADFGFQWRPAQRQYTCFGGGASVAWACAGPDPRWHAAVQQAGHLSNSRFASVPALPSAGVGRIGACWVVSKRAMTCPASDGPLATNTLFDLAEISAGSRLSRSGRGLTFGTKTCSMCCALGLGRTATGDALTVSARLGDGLCTFRTGQDIPLLHTPMRRRKPACNPATARARIAFQAEASGGRF